MNKNSFLSVIILQTLIIVSLSACNKVNSDAKLDHNPKLVVAPGPVITNADAPVELTTNELITNTLLNHYSKVFDQNNLIKVAPFKMYLIEDSENGLRKAYGYAAYYEYKIDDDKVKLDCGSGSTPIVLSFSLDGKIRNVDFEVLTESDYKSDKFMNAFPESIREKMIKRDMNDMKEIDDIKDKLVKEQYKEITGKDLTTPIN